MVLLALSLCLFTKTTWAYIAKEGNVTATFGPYFYETQFPGSPNNENTRKDGVSLIANGDLNDYGALEIAMFHMRKIFFREQAGLHIAEETELIHITLGYRHWITSRISSSLAFFSSYSMGQPHVVHTDFAPGNDIDTSARDITEYGFDGALQAELWESGRYALSIEGRYSYSVTAKKDEKANHYGVILGLRYFIQEQQIREKNKTDI